MNITNINQNILLSQTDEGLFVGGELHDEDCPCADCQEYNKRYLTVGQALPEQAWTIDDLLPETIAAMFEGDQDRLDFTYSERERKATLAAMAGTFDSMAQPVTLTDPPILPSLMVRDDGRTILYESKLNSVFGEPGVGKTWVAIMAAISAVRNGSNVLWWDFEDRQATLATRLAALGADDLIENPALRFVNDSFLEDETEEESSILPYAQAWLMQGQRPGLVVIDSCESAGCPSDGGAVKPWFDKFCKPWESIGATLLLLDHVPKRKEERPLGAIGSTHKRSKMTGAAIFVTGTPWNQLEGGKLLLVNHKDRAGQLMVSPNKPICNIIATYVEGVLAYTITPPEREDIDAAQVADSLLFEIAKMGSEGVTGSRSVRALVKHKGKTADIALEDLQKAGLVDRYKVGQAWLYYATPEGLEMAEGGD